jgi:hypothetical protein
MRSRVRWRAVLAIGEHGPVDRRGRRANTRGMNDPRKPHDSDKCDETPVREPLFRRYQIKIKAGVRTGPVPTGHPPIGF